MKKNSLWKIVYDRFEQEEEGLREAICTLGNGYFATRGAVTEAVPSERHYPGTYVAGLYNRLGTQIAGRMIFNEDLVNCPNWIHLTFKIGAGEWFCPSVSKILSYHMELDMQKGVLSRKIRFQTRKGQKTLVEEDRIVHMREPHLAAIRYVITPENYSDSITVRSMLDGAVLNMNVERYRDLNFNHWKPKAIGKFSQNGIYLSVKTSQSKIELCEAAKLRIFFGNKEKKPLIEILKHGKQVIGQEFRIVVEKGRSCQIEKIVSIYTSKDKGVKAPKTAAIRAVKNTARFHNLFKTHQQAWAELWYKFDLQIEGDPFSQRVLRLHMFHLLQTASIHNTNIDAGLPARGLHGEAYRGHVFWDELFAMHIFDFNMPEISKAFFMYRHRRLPQAREYAKSEGYRGAMFPWQSGSSGKEETQIVHLNPLSGKWGTDSSRRQRHISYAIAYEVWNHWKRTKDIDFMARFGAELMLSIAQFVGSLVYYSPKDARFHTKNVMGPDEFHEKLPNSSERGLRDNAYTNVMIVWILLKAKELLAILPHNYKTGLIKKLKITSKELRLWDNITKKMKIIINDASIISQFDGYFRLKELDWLKYRKKYGDIHRMDRILKSEGKSPDDYKVAKQADVLMLFYLLRAEEVQDILKRLGYDCDDDLLRKNYDYYIKRTSHGSTLSKVVSCFIAQGLGRKREFWSLFLQVLKSDIYDTQRGTTPEGIHIGVMGGSIDIVRRAVAGINILDDRIKITPNLPKSWRKIRLTLCYQKRWITFEIAKSKVKIHVSKSTSALARVAVEINSKLYSLLPGKTFEASLKK